ncbi:MAG: hypothetical protein GTN69_06890 [Armatimonadetes bacterium]|nr:hypothetical protein [Armatimonadota bacterium]
MAVIPKKLGSGGTALAKSSPVSLKDILFDAADDFAGLAAGAAAAVAAADVEIGNGVLDGLLATDPTTGSTQAAGSGNTDWNVDISAGDVATNDIEENFSAQTDFDVHSGSQLLTNGQAIYVWLLATESGGTVSQSVHKGTAATSGSETIPTDAEITAGVGHANWTKLSLLHLHRTGDTTLAQTQANRYRNSHLGEAAVEMLNAAKALVNAIEGYTIKTTKGT